MGKTTTARRTVKSTRERPSAAREIHPSDIGNHVEALFRSGVLLGQSPALLEYFGSLEKIAGYPLLDLQADLFQRACSWLVREPPTARLASLRDRSKPTHYCKLREGAWPGGHVHSGLARTRYHLERVIDLEGQIYARMTPQLRKELVRSQGVASGGNTLRLSFEYQAFIVAARTTLDYLAGTLNAYFGCEDASFHDWPDALDVAKPRDVARQMAKVLQPLHERLEHFYSSALRRSVRDRIAHYEFVPAAHISIGPLGVVLHEGGERLDGSAATQKLTNALTKHFDAVNQVVKETINTLIDLDEFQR